MEVVSKGFSAGCYSIVESVSTVPRPVSVTGITGGCSREALKNCQYEPAAGEGSATRRIGQKADPSVAAATS